MGRSGLRKVVKLVKGKKGTVRRSYWMKSAETSEKSKVNHAWSNRIYKSGLKNAFGIWGASAGSHIATRVDPNAPRGLVWGQLAGYGAGKFAGSRTYNLTKKLISDRDKRIIGMAAHGAAIAGSAYHLYSIHKRFPGAFDFFSKD